MKNNGIYILRTVKRSVDMDGFSEPCAPYYVWRVAHVADIEDFAYFQEHEPHQLGAYMMDM